MFFPWFIVASQDNLKKKRRSKRTENRRKNDTFRPQVDQLEDRFLLAAVRSIITNPGFYGASLPAGDDNSSGSVSTGFTIDYWGSSHSALYVNNNGNVTFSSAFGTYTPSAITGSSPTKIMAPFWADVDTVTCAPPPVSTCGPAPGSLVSYGQDTVDGHTAFAATWNIVGYFNDHADKRNTFQLVLIDRSDLATGDFDIEFNYDQIQWETGDYSGGSGGLGGTSAGVGYTNTLGFYFEKSGSRVPGSFLDSNSNGLVNTSTNSSVLGRHVYKIRNLKVKIEVPDASAAEVGTDPGQFKITREGDTTNALTVSYSITGKAANGVDYSGIGSSATISSGQTFTNINISPLRDMLLEKTEDVILTITSAPLSYRIISGMNTSTAEITNEARGRFPVTVPATPVVSADVLRTMSVPNQDVTEPAFSFGEGIIPYGLGNKPAQIATGKESFGFAASSFLQGGNAHIAHRFDLDRSPGACSCGTPMLVYNSATVDVVPVVQATVQTYAEESLPSTIGLQLTWNGTVHTLPALSTTGRSPGDLLTVAARVPTAVRPTGRYPWQLVVTLNYGTPVTHTITGADFVVALDTNNNNALGAGWSFSVIDRLVSIASDANGPAGKLRLYGTGGFRFYELQGSSYVSPGDDAGVLVQNGDSTFTYTAPDGRKWHFNSAGIQTSFVSADGHETTTFTYTDADSDGQQDDPATISFPDGAVATFSYSSGRPSTIVSPGRTHTFTYNGSGDVTQITNPDNGTHTFTFDSDHRITSDTFAGMPRSWSYSNGMVNSITVSSGATAGTTTITPVAARGLNSTAVGVPQAIFVNPLSRTTTYVLDIQGRVLEQHAPDGGLWVWSRDANGYITADRDGRGNWTSYSRDAKGYATFHSFNRSYEFQDQNGRHLLTRFTNENGYPTTYTYDNDGHRLTQTDAVGKTTTYAWSSGLLRSITDPLGRVTSYAYDSARRQTQAIEALGTSVERTTTMIYDAAGNLLSKTTGQSSDSSYAKPLTTSYAYDGMGRRTRVIEAYGTSLQRTTTTVYDAAGHVLSVTNPRGFTTSYAYDNRGLRTTITQPDPDGAGSLTSPVTSLAYDVAGNLTKETDPLNRVTTYVYDTMNRRTVVIQPDADGGWPFVYPTTTTVYDAFGNVDTVTDPLNHTTDYDYDSRNRRSRTTQPDPDGGGPLQAPVTQWAYDGANNLTQVTDPRSVITVHAYDHLNRRTRVIDASGTSLQRVTTTVYDAVGNAINVIDPLGRTTTHVYDALNRRIRTIQPDPDGAGSLPSPVTTTVYDAADNVVRAIDQSNRSTTYVYDSLNRRTTVIRPDPDGAGSLTSPITTTVYDTGDNVINVIDALNRTTTYAYDNLNRQVTVTQPDPDGAGLLTSPVGTTVYDAVGNVVQAIDPLNRTTTYVYDNHNRQTTVIQPDPDGAGALTSPRTTTVYDAAGNVTEIINARNYSTYLTYDALNRVTRRYTSLRTTTTTYDAAGNLTSFIDGRGNTTQYVYDALGRRTRVTEAVGTSVQRIMTTVYDAAERVTSRTDPLGRVTQYVYDNLDRQIRIIEAVGTSIQRTTTTIYDAAGHVSQVIDPMGQTTQYVYDELDRRIGVTEAAGTSLQRTTTTVYDAVGNVIAVTDPLNHTSTYVYDNLGRQTVVIQPDPDGGGSLASPRTTMTYDAVGNVLTVTDPANNTTSFIYDNLDRMTKETNALNLSRTFTYDAIGNITKIIDRKGRWRNFTYDGLNRVTTEDWYLPGFIHDRAIYVTYDANDNILTKGDSSGTYTFTYDALNRVATQKSPWNVSFTFTYDAVDNRTQIQDSLSGVMSSTYDALNRLTQRTYSGVSVPQRVDLTYNARDQYTDVSRFLILPIGDPQKAATSSFTYDALGRVSSIKHRDAVDAIFGDYAYGYDAADRLTSWTIGSATATYTYDNTDQLTAAGGSASENYSYDVNGNRTMSGYSTGTNNRLTNDGTWTYTYDSEGNLTKKSQGVSAETFTYGYDHLNRLVWAEKRATDGGTLQMRSEYTYDVFGNRIERQIDSDGNSTWDTWTRHVYVDQMTWADLDRDSALTIRYMFGDKIDEMFARIVVNDINWISAWYFTDHLGSVRNLTSSAGTVIATLDYNSFGKQVGALDSDIDRFRYTGREWDGETQIAYHRARHYDPNIGRFIQTDPIAFAAGDANLYRYVGNRPTIATDPLGLADKTVSVDYTVDGGWFVGFGAPRKCAANTNGPNGPFGWFSDTQIRGTGDPAINACNTIADFGIFGGDPQSGGTLRMYITAPPGRYQFTVKLTAFLQRSDKVRSPLYNVKYRVPRNGDVAELMEPGNSDNAWGEMKIENATASEMSAETTLTFRVRVRPKLIVGNELARTPSDAPRRFEVLAGVPTLGMEGKENDLTKFQRVKATMELVKVEEIVCSCDDEEEDPYA